MSTVARLKKLTAMPPSELGGRLAQATYRALERRVPGMTEATPRVRIGAVGAPRPLFPSLVSVTDTIDALRRLYPAQAQRSVERAAGILADRIVLFGEARHFPSGIDWHADPVSGHRWPLTFFADAPIGRRDVAPGDAKDVWEVNRHQFLVDLGKAWRLTDDARYAECAWRLVESWIDANPYAQGVNWAGPLEVAYRALSWIWLHHLIDGSRPMADEAKRKWLASFCDHGRFLYRHLELFESPYNHLIGEATVLYLLGLQFPDLDEARRWQHRGRSVIESRLSAQFYADGGSVEQATVYHHATLAYLLLAAVGARQAGDGLHTTLWDVLERAVDFSAALVQPDGRHPALGDNDDARPLAFDAPDTWDYRHLIAIGAVLFGRADFKFVASRVTEDGLWLLGPDGVRAFDAMASRPPEPARVLDASGYVVLRSGMEAEADYVVFDCGEQAGGLRTDDVPSAAHGHADALSVVAHLGGIPVLVDPGFFTYDGERDWERHFRETAAHNTVRVGGRDQATHLEKMAWARIPRVTWEGCGLPLDQWARASHDGYAREMGVVHRRTVWLRDGYLLLFDELVGEGARAAEVVFQFAPGHRLDLGAHHVGIGERFLLSWAANVDLRSRIECGGRTPDAGWVAPRLGHKVAASRLVLESAPAKGLRVLTTLVDRRRWSRVDVNPGAAALVLRLTGPRGEDVLCAPAAKPFSGEGIRTDADLVAMGRAGATVDVRHIGGTHAEARP